MNWNWDVAQPFILASLFQVWVVIVAGIIGMITEADLNGLRNVKTHGTSAEKVKAGTSVEGVSASYLPRTFSTKSLRNLFARNSDAAAALTAPAPILIAIVSKNPFGSFSVVVGVVALILGGIACRFILTRSPDGYRSARLGWFSAAAIGIIAANVAAGGLLGWLVP